MTFIHHAVELVGWLFLLSVICAVLWIFLHGPGFDAFRRDSAGR